MNITRCFLFLLLITFLPKNVYSTFIRGADLTYSVVGYNVTFNLVLYEELSGTTFDSLEISYGDGNTGYLVKLNTITQSGIKFSNYQGNYTYPGDGTYSINVCDLVNRTSGITNINNSVNTPLSLVAELTLSSFNIFSSSPLFGNDHFNKMISGDTVFHNTGTYDPDGDSLTFELVNCFGDMCTSLNSPTEYTYPSTFGGGQSIDTMGILSYSVPISNVRFSFAIKVSKWRNGNLLCTAMRDILIENYWVGINEIAPNFTFLTLFPNPNTGKFYIEVKNVPINPFFDTKIEVYDLVGNIVFQSSNRLFQNLSEVDISSQSTGIYLVKVYFNDAPVGSIRVVKQ